MSWWREIESWANCYHPISDRYYPCAQVQKCGWCGAIRFASEGDNHWPPVVRPTKEMVSGCRRTLK